MIKINENSIRIEYNKYKDKAKVSLEKKELNKALNYCEYIALIARGAPISEDFCDLDVEKILEEIGKELIPKNEIPNSKGKENRIIFYTTEIIDRGALTEQYLNFFMSQNYEILLVVPNKKNITGNNYINLLRNYKNYRIFYPKGNSRDSKIIEISKEIINFEPSKAFLQFVPNDVVGFTVFSQFKNIERYYIDHNDHTFWLGVNCADYFIEFRTFGYLISKEKRKIPEEKLTIIKYYPIIDGNPFEGFPIDISGKIVGFTGANLGKFEIDSTLRFFWLIKKILEENENFIFFIAGGWNDKFLKDFISNNKLETRLIYLGYRKDFYEVMKRIDIFFEPYPFNSGLITQYACLAQKPMVVLEDEKLFNNSIEDFLGISGDKISLHTDSEFIEETNKLVQDEIYRRQKGQITYNPELNEKYFNKSLENFVKNKEKDYKLIPVKFSREKFLEYYLSLQIKSNNMNFIKLVVLHKNNNLIETIILIIENLLSNPKYLFKYIVQEIKRFFK